MGSRNRNAEKNPKTEAEKIPQKKWDSQKNNNSHGVIMPCHVSGQCLDLVGPLWVPVPVHCASAHFAGGTNPSNVGCPPKHRFYVWVDILHCYRKFRGTKCLDLIHVVGSTQFVYTTLTNHATALSTIQCSTVSLYLNLPFITVM